MCAGWEAHFTFFHFLDRVLGFVLWRLVRVEKELPTTPVLLPSFPPHLHRWARELGAWGTNCRSRALKHGEGER